MDARKFRVGDIVKLVATSGLGRGYKIVQALPFNGRHFEYKIKHPAESFERIAPEYVLDRLEENVG